MITIKTPIDCCGCGACVQVCPKQCIHLKEDAEGFLYPEVDESVCIDCGLCEKVCPITHQAEKKLPLKVYAAINPNEKVRFLSSSGGIFIMLAEAVIRRGGVVFGARFNERWEVIHDYAETIEGISAFRESKYVQSYMGDCYKMAESFLKGGREVLFSGTPCQIAALRRFLRKEYENLIGVDIICHGVPSPKVWRLYLQELLKGLKIDTAEIEHINFRDKTYGWKRFSFSLLSDKMKYCEPFNENVFMKGFLSDLYLRPSCYQCPSRAGKSGSDITIADYWNIPQVFPDFDDDKGVCIVLVNSEKGKRVCESLNFISRITEYEDVKPKNGGFKEVTSVHPNRDYFFNRLDSCKELINLIERSLRISLRTRIQRKLFSLYHRLLKH